MTETNTDTTVITYKVIANLRTVWELLWQGKHRVCLRRTSGIRDLVLNVGVIMLSLVLAIFTIQQHCEVAAAMMPIEYIKCDGKMLKMTFDTGCNGSFISVKSPSYNQLLWNDMNSGKYKYTFPEHILYHEHELKSIFFFSYEPAPRHELKKAGIVSVDKDGILGSNFMSTNGFSVDYTGILPRAKYHPSLLKGNALEARMVDKNANGIVDAVLVNIVLKNINYSMLVDTGSHGYVIDAKYSKLINDNEKVTDKSVAYSNALNDYVDLKEYRASVVVSAARKITIDTIYLGDISSFQLSKYSIPGRDCIGVLGSDILYKYKIIIDYHNKCLLSLK
jgi:predicted aspartyl protease